MEEAPHNDPKDDLLELEFEPDDSKESPADQGDLSTGMFSRPVGTNQKFGPRRGYASSQSSQLNLLSLSGYFKEQRRPALATYSTKLPGSIEKLPETSESQLDCGRPKSKLLAVSLPPISAPFPSLKSSVGSKPHISLAPVRLKKILSGDSLGKKTQVVTNMINLFSKIRPTILVEPKPVMKRNHRSLKLLKCAKSDQTKTLSQATGPQELRVLPILDIGHKRDNSLRKLSPPNKPKQASPEPIKQSDHPEVPKQASSNSIETERAQISARDKQIVLQNFYKNSFAKRSVPRQQASPGRQTQTQTQQQDESPPVSPRARLPPQVTHQQQSQFQQPLQGHRHPQQQQQQTHTSESRMSTLEVYRHFSPSPSASLLFLPEPAVDMYAHRDRDDVVSTVTRQTGWRDTRVGKDTVTTVTPGMAGLGHSLGDGRDGIVTVTGAAGIKQHRHLRMYVAVGNRRPVMRPLAVLLKQSRPEDDHSEAMARLG